MTNMFKRFMSLALVLVMVIGMLPVSAFAVEGDPADNVILEFNFSESDVVTDEEGNATGVTGLANGNEVTAELVGVTIETDEDGNEVAVFKDDDFDPALRDTVGIKYAPAETTAEDGTVTSEDPLKVLEAGSAVTVSMWIKTNKTAEENICSSLFAYGSKNINNNTELGATAQLLEVPSTTNCVYYRNQTGSTNNYKFAASGNVYKPGQWQLVTLVDDGTGSVDLYVDGVKVGGRSENKAEKSISGYAHDSYAPDAYYIGYVDYLDAGDSTDAHFEGAIDSVTIYAGELTAEQVADLYEERQIANAEWLDVPQDTITLAAGETKYYTARVGGMVMTVNGDVTVEHNGETFTAVDGVVTLTPVQTSMWEPPVFKITNGGEAEVSAAVSFAYPAGTSDNPAELVIGENVASIAAGSQGYYYTWTASEAGTLTVTMSEGNWFYSINNLTAGTYGDGQWSDSDPVVNPAVVEVAAGDELQILVNTYDPANMWNAPAGELAVSVAFEAAAVEPPVEDIIAEEIVAVNSAVEITVGETKALEYTLNPEGANVADISWYSQDTAIAEVDGTGNVYGVAAGTVVIEATLNGRNTVAYTVTVAEETPDVPPVTEDGVILDIDFTDVAAAEDGTVTVNSEVGELALTVGNAITVADGVATFAEGNNGIYANSVDNATDPMKALSGASSTTNIWMKSDLDTFACTMFAYGHVQENLDLGASMELLAVANVDYDAICYYRNEGGATNGQKIQGYDASKYVAGQWQLLSLVENNGTVTVYVNGVQIGQKTDVSRSMYGWANDALLDNYYIGTKHAAGTQTPFIGQIDRLTVVDKAMTAEDLMAMYEERVYGAGIVMDSAWEIENQNDNMTINDDGTITVVTEQGTIGGDAMENVLYYELPVTNDYVFTVKVNGEFTADYQGAYLMITTGLNLENAVGVVRRHHEWWAANRGAGPELFGVMQEGDPGEYYINAPEDTASEFYLKLQKQGSKITGYFAKEYSDDPAAWTLITDGTNELVTKDALGGPEKLYLALGACAGGTNAATPVTFSDLRVNGEAVSFTTDPRALKEIELTGDAEMLVGKNYYLSVKATDYAGLQTEVDSLTYTSSDETVATVSDTGVVTGLTDGFVTIIATAVKGGVTKSDEITVQIGEIKVDGSWTVTSPDGNTSITVELITGGTLQYRTVQGEYNNIQNSSLGMVTNLGDFSKNLVLKEASEVTEINETYKMLSGKDDEYVNHCNEQTLTFVRKDNADVEFDVVIRAYDDGTAYRYGIRGEDGAELSISDETSGLTIPAEATVYWMNYSSAGWNYESNYNTATTESLAAGSTPSMPFMYGKDGVWTLFTEANLHGTYTGSMLTVTETGLMDIAFSKKQGSTAVKTTVPFESPWRVAITGDLEAIVENTLVENLADPADEETYKFSEWVYPGLSSWSWVANWGSGISDQSKAETHLNWIEFGAEIGWDFYILDEGWAAQGRGNVQPNENGMRDWWPEVKAAAEEAGVKLWAWVHVSDIRDNAKREALFEYWASEGIVGIKPDFFDGEDQSTIRLYDELYEDAAKYGLMVLVHGANKPTGEVRTWPNVYGREAIKGQESGGITAEQYTLIPYIRAAIGPAEVTEELRSKDTNKTTQGFQIALTALIEDGIHSMGSAPNVYRDNPEGMAYYTNYPTGWIDTEFVSGEIGQYLNIARLANNGTDEWYLSGISVDARTQNVPLSFLDSSKVYTAMLYRENGRTDLVEEVIPAVTSESELEISNLYGGGYAVRLIPVDGIETYTKITAPAELSVEERLTVTPEIVCEPADAEYTNLVWSSADESIATVEDGVITGVAEGTTTITVAAAFAPTVKAEIKVTVTPSSFEYIKLEAENGALVGEANVVANANASNGQHVGNVNGDTATVTFTVESGKACTTTMEIWYATYSARDFGVTVNGGTKQVINGGGTGDWTVVGDDPLVLTIELVEGTNTIVVGGGNGYAPNLDYIVVAIPKATPGGVLTAEETAAKAGAEVKVPLTLANVEAMLASEGTDGTIGGFQFTVNGGETVALKGFEPAEVFAGYDWTVQDNVVLGFDLTMAENSSAAVTEDTVIGSLVLETSADFTGAVVTLEDVSVCDGVGVNYNVTADAIKLTLAADEFVNPFIDVEEDDYFYASTMWAVQNGITVGDGAANTFNPEGECIRAQVVTFLWRAAGEPEPETDVNPFTDVEDDDYFYKAVLWAVENGITKGTSATEFSPDESCTRAQVAAFLYRYAGEPGHSVESNPFTDVESDEYYYDAVLWAVENGITVGDGADNIFNPDGTCTRAQIVTFLYRAVAE